MRVSHIVPKFVVSFPLELDPGVLYISSKFSTASHLCACGCRREVITPLSPAQWTLTYDGSVSVWPSIGNWSLPCGSHYVIDHGTIRWARAFTSDEVRLNRESDHRILDEAQVNQSPARWPRRLLRRHRIR